jgi:hypothetical protein
MSDYDLCPVEKVKAWPYSSKNFLEKSKFSQFIISLFNTKAV